VTAPDFAPVRYPDFGAVATFPVWGQMLASAWSAACDGVAIDVGDNAGGDIAGELRLPQARWVPAARRVTLAGAAQIIAAGPVGTDLIDVLDIPAGFTPAVTRTGAAASSGGWVRWLVPSVAAGQPGTLQILTIGGNFPPVTLGVIAWLDLTGITWRVPRTP
jgi:hypothetical protein